MKQKEWEYAITQLVGNSTLHSSFVVDNHDDAEKLRGALKSVYRDYPIPEVIISQFQGSVYDVSQNVSY